MMDQAIIRVSETKWIVIDDEGNRFVHSGIGYTHLQIGESEPYMSGYSKPTSWGSSGRSERCW